MDFKQAVNDVADKMEKACVPLSEAQKKLLDVEMTKWLESARTDGLRWAQGMAKHCAKTGVNYP